jgi:hypothetical protein
MSDALLLLPTKHQRLAVGWTNSNAALAQGACAFDEVSDARTSPLRWSRPLSGAAPEPLCPLCQVNSSLPPGARWQRSSRVRTLSL